MEHGAGTDWCYWSRSAGSSEFMEDAGIFYKDGLIYFILLYGVFKCIIGTIIELLLFIIGSGIIEA